MSYQLYYSAPDDTLLFPIQVKRKTGIPINVEPLLDPPQYDPTEHIEALNRAQIYPLTVVGNPHDITLFSTTFTHVVSNHPNGAEVYGGYPGLPGDYATATYTATALPLAEAKTAAIKTLKERAKADAEAASNGFPVIALAASASKTSSSRDATVQSALDGVNAVLTQLVADVATANAATTVADIDTLINS